MPPPDAAPIIAASVAREGFARSEAAAIAPDLERRGARDWSGFAASWDDLGLDVYMADGGRYRRRRHAVLLQRATGWTRAAHRPHYQSRDYNRLNGGVARWFEPILDATLAHPCLGAALGLARDSFARLAPEARWEVELHQFRITAAADGEGRPTPEGMHRDGVDFAMVMLVRRQNVESGITLIEDGAGRKLGSFVLAAPMDATFVDDHRVLHGVTPIVPIDPMLSAWRDVLVATFRGH